MNIHSKKSDSSKHVFEIDPDPVDQSLQKAMEMHEMMAKTYWAMIEKNLEYMGEAMRVLCDSSPLKNIPNHDLCENWLKEVRAAQDASLNSMRELMDGYFRPFVEFNVSKDKK
jgi:hypothetical protein